MATANDTKYLKKRKNRDVWMFSMRVPKTIQHLYEGKAVYTRSLQTACIKTARLRRDQLLAQISLQKEQAIDGGRSTFISFYNTLTQAKEQYGGSDPLAPYNQLDTSILTGTDSHPDIQRDARAAANIGIIPIEYSYTLREAMNDWLAKNQRKNKDTLSKMKSTSERFLRHCEKHDMPLMVIDRASVVSFIEELIKDYTASTVTGHISRLKTIYKHAWSMAKIDKKDNPFESHSLAHYETHRTTTKKKQLYSREQIQRIVEWAKDHSDTMHLMVQMGIYTGCRISELCQIRAVDVHQENELMAVYLKIRGTDSLKTPAALRTVPIPNVIHELIKTRLATLKPNDRLIGLDGKQASRLYSRFKVAKISKDKSLCFHSFRVHVSTALSRAGVKEVTAAFIIGHAGGQTMTYGYYAKADELKELAIASEQAAQVIERDWL